jgi:uncharacterized protein YkwD
MAALIMFSGYIYMNGHNADAKKNTNSIRKIKTSNEVDTPQNLKVYRSVTSAMLEWDKVAGAKGYKIYAKKKGTKKWVYLGKVKEKTYKKVQVDYRQFVTYNKNVSKRETYKYEKGYTYRVYAYKKINGKEVYSKPAQKYAKKHKKKKVEFGYDGLAITNKIRIKKGRKIFVWDHTLEKGAKIRAKELATSFSHTRPDGTDCSTAWLSSKIYDKDGITGQPTQVSISGENVSSDFGGNQICWQKIVDGYLSSPGHSCEVLEKCADYVTKAGEEANVYATSDEGEKYVLQYKKGDIIRYTGGLCCVSYRPYSGGPFYYEYARSSVESLYSYNGKLIKNNYGENIRNGKVIYGVKADTVNIVDTSETFSYYFSEAYGDKYGYYDTDCLRLTFNYNKTKLKKIEYYKKFSTFYNGGKATNTYKVSKSVKNDAILQSILEYVDGDGENPFSSDYTYLDFIASYT